MKHYDDSIIYTYLNKIEDYECCDYSTRIKFSYTHNYIFPCAHNKNYLITIHYNTPNEMEMNTISIYCHICK